MTSVPKKILVGPNDRRNRNRAKSGQSKSKSKSRMPCSSGSIVFCSLYVVAQYYMLRMYNDAVLTNYGNNHDHGFKVPSKEIPTTNSEEQSQPPPRINKDQPVPDGTFNGYPIYKLKKQHQHQKQQQQHQNSDHTKDSNIDVEELYSQFHCVGETWHNPEFHRRSRTYHEQSWMYRSCRFQIFCYDTETQDYVVYLDPEKHKASQTDHHYHGDENENETTNNTINANSNNNNNKNTANNSSSKIFHPSPQIQKIIDAQRKQISKELSEVADQNHSRNTTTMFKHPTFRDDTSTVYRNHTIVVNGKGEVIIGDTQNGKQYGVAIGSINGKWGLVDIQLLKWFPEVRWGPVPGTGVISDGNNDNDNDKRHEVYMLPSSVALIPFHSLSAENPGHLVWDDLLPMFTLLDMFGFLKRKTVDLLPIRYELPGKRGLWAGCDWQDAKKEACHKMLSKFGTLMGTRRSYLKFFGSDDHELIDKNDATTTTTTTTKSASKLPKIPITTNRGVQLDLAITKRENSPGDSSSNNNNTKHRRLGESQNNNGQSTTTTTESSQTTKPTLICAKNGIAGFGALSDHLPNYGHGWSDKDYRVSYNSGRGGKLWEFRNFMIHNLFESLLPKKNNNEMTTKRRLAFNAPKIEKGKPNVSVTLGNDKRSSYPPSSITDAGPDEPLVVMYSAYSSQRRGGSMAQEADAILRDIERHGGVYPYLYGREAVPGEVGANVDIVVESHIFAKYSLEEQIQMASRTAVFATYCGGGAITASFLPRGGAVHMYYGETAGIQDNVGTGLPARLDWDFFNNCGYLHVRWIPYFASAQKWPKNHTDGGGFGNQMSANVHLMKAELRRIHIARVKHHQQQQHQTQEQS